jgi:hypothetical protein
MPAGERRASGQYPGVGRLKRSGALPLCDRRRGDDRTPQAVTPRHAWGNLRRWRWRRSTGARRDGARETAIGRVTACCSH